MYEAEKTGLLARPAERLWAGADRCHHDLDRLDGDAMRNKYPGICYRCGKRVEVGKGHFERYRGRWRLQHADCAIVYRGTDYSVEEVRQMKPSIGRIVHYHSSLGTTAALVIYVNEDETVSLQVFLPDGRVIPTHNIPQGDDLGQWSWPPRT